MRKQVKIIDWWDNLTKDAIRADNEGTSYGRWKPEHPHTKLMPEEENLKAAAEAEYYREDGTKLERCKGCGARYLPSRVGQKYCCKKCGDLARRRKEEAYGQDRRQVSDASGEAEREKLL